MMLDLTEKVATHVVFSEEGKRIGPGELYFVGQKNGQVAYFTTLETEKLLGLRDVSTAERKRLASKGAALKDGSFPINSCSDAMNARKAIGRANPGKRGTVRAHIARQESRLGCKHGPMGGS
jgi:hypothetical protein